MHEDIDDTGREVICKKKHICEWCGEPIEKGSKAVVRVYKWDGEFNNARQHPECYEAMNDSTDFIEDGFTQYEQDRGSIVNNEDHYNG